MNHFGAMRLAHTDKILKLPLGMLSYAWMNIFYETIGITEPTATYKCPYTDVILQVYDDTNTLYIRQNLFYRFLLVLQSQTEWLVEINVNVKL